jgi:hypothetical protein
MERRRGPQLGQLIAAAQNQRAREVGTGGPPGLAWFIDVRFDEPGWYQTRARPAALVDALAATSWFRELTVLGRDHKAGVPFESAAAASDVIACGERGTFILARGEPRMAVDVEDAELALAIDIGASSVELRLWFRAGALAQYRGALLGEIIGLLIALREAWRDAVIANAYAFPSPQDALSYRRPRPLRTAARALDAIVDIVDRGAPAGGPPWARDAHLIAAAAVPAGVERQEHGPLVCVRWIGDPADTDALAEACARHAQWLIALVPTQIVLGWNEQGDLQVPLLGAHPKPAPLSLFDDQRRAGYLALDVADDGAIDEAAWRRGEEVLRTRRLGSGAKVAEVSLIAQDRSAALRIAERAHAAGFEKVLYRRNDDELWDPFPPGQWSE